MDWESPSTSPESTAAVAGEAIPTTAPLSPSSAAILQTQAVIERGIERAVERAVERGIQRVIQCGIQRGIECGIHRVIKRGIQRGIQSQ